MKNCFIISFLTYVERFHILPHVAEFFRKFGHQYPIIKNCIDKLEWGARRWQNFQKCIIFSIENFHKLARKFSLILESIFHEDRGTQPRLRHSLSVMPSAPGRLSPVSITLQPLISDLSPEAFSIRLLASFA